MGALHYFAYFNYLLGKQNNKVVGGVAIIKVDSWSAFDVLVVLNYIIVVDW